MKRFGRMLAAAALLTAGAPQLAFAQTEETQGRVALDSAFLVGLWTDDDDCADAIRFAGNGEFVAANGGTGRWALQGDRLMLAGSSLVAVRIAIHDADTIDVINADGSVGHSTRCPAADDDDDSHVMSDIA
ncbi:MAG: hypothetical protein JO276_00965 [Sphingomonadaceae bacterium]|nr:hypothetical protein [Sphingomonadaceae bacterium]